MVCPSRREANRRKYKERKDLGLCTLCGKKERGKTLVCEGCRLKRNLSYKPKGNYNKNGKAKY